MDVCQPCKGGNYDILDNDNLSEQEIKDSNKLIAEFMGLKYHDSYGYHRDIYFESAIEIDGEVYSPEYHSSWDWLMPVVEKTISIEGVTVKTTNWLVDIYYNDNRTASSMAVLKTDNITMIDCYYKAVVNFIHWYNQQEK